MHYQGRWPRVCAALVGLTLMTIGFAPLYAQSAPENRIALVIGNSFYASNALRLPAGDTTLVAGALAAAGFRVTLIDDLGLADMQQAVADFATALHSPDTVGLFYFAGHGAQYGGHSYLLPVDTYIQGPEDLPNLAVDVDTILTAMNDSGSRLNIAVFDAARENPFPNARAARAEGLAPLRIRMPHSLMMYARQPGVVTPEENKLNSSFAAAFAAAVSTGQNLAAAVQRTANDTRAATQGRDVPVAVNFADVAFSFRKDVMPAQSPLPVRPAPVAPAPAPAPVQPAPVAPAPAPLPDLASLDIGSFVKTLPASRVIAVKTKLGYYATSGQLAALDARMPPLVLKAYSYAGSKGETLRAVLSSPKQMVLYVCDPAGKTTPYFPNGNTVDASAVLEQTGTYTLVAAAPESLGLGPYSLAVFGNGTQVSGELTIFDPADPDVFGNHIHNMPLDTDPAVYTLKLESGDFQTAVKVLDSNGKQIAGQADTQGNTTVFTFPSPGGKLTVVVRSGGSWPTGKFKMSVRATDVAPGQ